MFGLFKKSNKQHVKLVRMRNVRGRYDVASTSPESTRHWLGADALAADSALSQSVRQRIIRRARYEAANNGYLAGIISTLANDTIGTGPRLQLSSRASVNTANEKRLDAREHRFADWMRKTDMARKLKIARRSKALDGEVFLLKTRKEIGGVPELEIVLYEAEQVGDNDFTPQLYESGALKSFDGIEYAEDGSVSSYTFYKVHPGEMACAGVQYGETVRRPASAVIQYANIERPGQHRGVSEFASTLDVFNDIRRYTTAVIDAAETAAAISFVLQTDSASCDENGDPVIQHMDAGTVMDICRNAGISLPEGWKATQMKSEQPTSTHAEFIRVKIREAARCVSMPLNVALGDSSGYNYASGRLDHQTYFRAIESERSQIETTVLNDILRTWESIDRITHPEDYGDGRGREIRVQARWMWDGFAHVDPLKEANAQNIRLNSSHTSTLAEECGAEGKDYTAVLEQQAREAAIKKRLAEEYGIPDIWSGSTQQNESNEEDE